MSSDTEPDHLKVDPDPLQLRRNKYSTSHVNPDNKLETQRVCVPPPPQEKPFFEQDGTIRVDYVLGQVEKSCLA